ncbi:hypothetical protein ACFTAO_33410 [Paenibacillus rhizoplanae]
MFKLGETIQFEDQANDVLTVGELLVDMISNEYGEDTVCDGYTRYFWRIAFKYCHQCGEAGHPVACGFGGGQG